MVRVVELQRGIPDAPLELPLGPVPAPTDAPHVGGSPRLAAPCFLAELLDRNDFNVLSDCIIVLRKCSCTTKSNVKIQNYADENAVFLSGSLRAYTYCTRIQ